MLKFITKVLGKRTYRLYLNPDTNEYQRKQDLRNYVKSLEMTEQDWYNDRFLPKDQDGNPIIPICKKSGCNNECKFLNCIEGYYCACSVSHGKSYQSTLEYKIERYGEDEALRMDKEMKDRMSKSKTLQGYIDRFGSINGPRRWKEDNKKKCHSLENFIKRYGPVDGPIEFKKYRETRKHSMSLEGMIERFGEDLGIVKYNESKSKRRNAATLQGLIDKLGEDEGTARYNEISEAKSKGHTLEGYIDKHGKDLGIKMHEQARKSRSFSRSIEGYIDRYGPELGPIKYEEHNQSRKLDLDSYIRRYGEEEGARRYKEDCKAGGFRRTREGFIKKFGEVEGNKRYDEMIEHASYVRSLEGHIDKYGPVEGPKKWEGWISNIGFSRGINGDNSLKYSRVSQSLFDELLSRLYGMVNLSDVLYGTDEWRVTTGSKNYDISLVRFLDFSIPKYKLAIEFDGDYWHPTITEEDIIEFSTGVVKDWDILNTLSRGYSLTKLGWKVLHIRECNYYEDPDREINKCIDFIKSIVLYNKN